ncbi:hypothetical protein PHYSODRAFT_439699, partial [Phytophthora sojae]
MTNMKGLERIQQMIFFFSWKRQAVQRRLHRVQERLACSLFTCHPVAALLLMEVRDVCADIEREAERDYTQADTSYTLERLAHLHRERVRAAKAAIAKKIHALCVTIDSATQNISRYKEGEGCSYAITDHEAFSKALRLSSLRERMFTFLRLVDCHVAESVYQHVTLVVRDLRARICGVPSISLTTEDRSAHFLVDDVDFDGDVNSSTMQLVPTKVEVLDLVHSILLKYCVAMDGLPRVLTNGHFKHVLTPFVPSVRRDFAASLLKPSHLVFESYEPELREMRSALDLHFRRIGILQQEHLRCVRAIKVAERASPVARDSAAELDEDGARLPQLPDLTSSAAAYELAQKTWSRFVQYSSSAAPMLQVGYLLLDQSLFVEKLRRHVSKRVDEMDDALPSIYQQFLASLLEDVDGCIEKVTKIPTDLAEANVWLAQVTSMMQTHPFRQRLDAKIANLARLRALIKERGILSLDQEVQESIRKLELTWESVIETLLMCLARVEERGSEHRRSVLDVISKVDEYITAQLQRVVKTFEGLPSGYLVAMDLERKNVVQQYEEYDREHRAIMDLPPTQQAVWSSSASDSSSDKLSVVSMADKLPSELLLLYIVTSLELRQWYASWKKLREKWLGSPLSGVHPGTMINHIKQFRRRLGYASSRLSRLSSDFELMRTFDASIEDMLNCNRIFQAISGGAFSDARWAAMNQLLNVQSGPNGASGGGLTLRRMKEQCDPDQINALLEFCDECIVEAKLHTKLEQARQRLARIEVRVEETNYSVRCEGIAEALAQLDDIAVELKLCLFGQNPELHLCLELRADMEQKIAVCKHIHTYQKHWRLRCEATKLHEVDEFFSKRFSGGGGGNFAVPRGRTAQHKSGLKQEQALWHAFLEASHAWSDRLRRLFFVSPHQPQVEQKKAAQPVLLGKKTSVFAGPAVTVAVHRRLSAATKSMNCTLDDVMESFEGFDFETNLAACERGMELVLSYLDSVREKLPRMYCLDETTMLGLLLRDSDMQQLHQALAICFPRVHRFAISRAANRVGSSVEIYGKQESLGAPVRASKTDGTIVISGLDGVQGHDQASEKCGCFRLPVAKIGRVKFWFTRLEEEMSSMVVADLKRAFEWVTLDSDSSEALSYEAFLPQSIVTASALRFTFEMNRAHRSEEHDLVVEQLQRLHLAITERLGALDDMKKHCSSGACSSRPERFKLERRELFPTSPDFLKAPSSSQSGQSVNLSVSCQVAHLQMPLGQEFVGWGKLAIISPFTQRCSYALFSALRMQHTALVVPYNVHQAGNDPTALVRGVAQLLMRPCIEFSCDPSAGVTTIRHLDSLANAVSRLNGFLIVRALLHLSAALVGAVSNSLVLPRHAGGGLSYGASAIFIPLDSSEDLQKSGLVQAIRTQFRAVAVARPAARFLVECLLLADGFTVKQIRELNVIAAFEAIEAEKTGAIRSLNVEELAPRIVEEARRLHEHYRVGGMLVSKSKGDEEAVAAAVSIYLESAYSLPGGCEQFELIMELWRALQTFPAALVYGSPGSGKTTCVTALHRALVALELSEQDEDGEEPSHAQPPSTMKQLRTAPGSDSLKWILVDGEVDGGVLDRLLEGDNRACVSTSSLPPNSILYRDLNSCVLSGDCADPRYSPRLLFEVTSVANLSPSALRRCWALHVPARCITAASIIASWRTRWENLLVFQPDSRGFEAMAVVFKTVQVLVLNICVGFVVEEATHSQGEAVDELVGRGTLRLGFLSLNHLTQTALTFVSVCCFQNKSLLQELSYLRLVELATFAVLWGFVGHLPDPFKPKLENYVRMKSKEHSDIKHLAEVPRGLLDADGFEDVWDELQPRFAAPAFDSSSGQVLVLVPAATSLIRMCTVLLHSWRSFVLIGPAASGKTSLLRWLVQQNREAEAAEMKIETSLDERHVHGILDWTGVPAAWFQPLDRRDSAASSRAKMREETELFAGRSRHSFVFLDDLNA